VQTPSAPPILDGHNDTLLKLRTAADPEDGSFFVHRPKGHIDLPRAREGNFAGGLFAIFVNGVEPEEKDPDAIAAMVRRRPELSHSLPTRIGVPRATKDRPNGRTALSLPGRGCACGRCAL
jgi:microsomal dipeptidase-like Zn-dependent dipeptidase